ncbi:hypothetical protein BLOT_015797, partial [Blomia tropicalis]
HLLLLTDFDNFCFDSCRFCYSETIKAIFEFVQCTVFEIFEVKDHLWGNATLRNFNETKICKKVTFLGRFHFLNREFNVFSNYTQTITRILVFKTEKLKFLENKKKMIYKMTVIFKLL